MKTKPRATVFGVCQSGEGTVYVLDLRSALRLAEDIRDRQSSMDVATGKRDEGDDVWVEECEITGALTSELAIRLLGGRGWVSRSRVVWRNGKRKSEQWE